MGSVFSPAYAKARARGATPAASFPAVNVALYRPGGDRWVMTERAPSALSRESRSISIGASAMRWDGDALVLTFDERCATFPSPLPARLRGSVRITPRWIDGAPVGIDGRDAVAVRHRWWPIAPSARAEVRLSEPGLAFRGEAYLDANEGDEPLESAFLGWNWARLAGPRGTTVAYHTTPRDGAPLSLMRRYDHAGGVTAIEGVPMRSIARTGWGVPREVAADRGVTPRAVRSLEDTPFYARSLIETQMGGESGIAIHEALDAQRFAQRWVQFLLPFRARRVGPGTRE